jgi:hypothetical protein
MSVLKDRPNSYCKETVFSIDRIRSVWLDITIAFGLGLLGAIASFWGAQFVDPKVTDLDAINIWFEADLPRVYANMNSGSSTGMAWMDRTAVHPLFLLIAFPPTVGLRHLLNLEPRTATQIIIAIVALLWVAALFALLRVIGCQRFDAGLFCLLGGTSAAAMFWFSIAETYSFGSLTIVLGLLFAALTQHYWFSRFWYIGVNLLTFSITVTNWMVGILATWMNHPTKRTIWIGVQTFFLTVGLWCVQKIFFPGAGFLFLTTDDVRYIAPEEAGGWLKVLQSFLAHTMVMPVVEVFSDRYPDKPERLPIMLTQISDPGSASVWGTLAVVCWLALLALGLLSLFSLKKARKLRWVLGLTLLGQLVLHLLYGGETFLYSLHFIPLFVVLGALTTLTRWRWAGLGLAVLVVAFSLPNNIQQFQEVTEIVSQLVAQLE